MKWISMTRRKAVFPFLLLVAASALPAYGQNPKLELKDLEKLSSKASNITDVTLDGPMLQFASKFIEKDDSEEAEIKELIKTLKGVYVKSFEFDKDNQYSQADVDMVRAQLAAPGWTRLVENRSTRTHETNEIYLMKQGENIIGVAILVAEPREFTIVNIVGPINLEKLSALEDDLGVSKHRSRPDAQGSDKPKKENASHEKK